MSRKPAPGTGADRRAAQPDRDLERQYVGAAVVFVLLVVAIILLFGHLISRSLSRRYLEDVLVSGKQEAEQLARDMETAGDTSIYQVVEKRRETLLRRGTELAQRQIFERVVIRDTEGNVVWEATLQARQVPPGERLPESLELSPDLKREVQDSERTYELHAPVGDIGEVVLLASKGVLARRIARLRRELLVQTLLTALLTLFALSGAFALMWHLVQRNRRLEAQRHEAQELADLGALAANLAHEIRNPLNSINLNLELLDEDLEGVGDQARTSLESTRREVGRLAGLVTDFLNYARPAEPVMAPVVVAELFQEVAEFLKAEAHRMGVHLRVLPPAPGVQVRGDASQLRQVLLNLILNAVQAVAELTPDRRVVTLTTDPSGEEGSVTVVVHDRGDGIPEEELARVRRAFYSRRRGGTGLGLPIAERIVRRHGGELVLTNVEGGFEARIVLPRSEGDVSMGDGSGDGSTGDRGGAHA